MKKTLVMTIMASLMVLSSAAGIMAEENVTAEKRQVTISSEYAYPAKISENSDSLYMNKIVEENENGAKTFASGTVTKESFEKILNSLNKSENEKEELLKKFDENLEINKKANELYKDIENKSVNEIKEIGEKADEIFKNQYNLFDDEIIEKALELKIIEKIYLETLFQGEEGTLKSGAYSIKINKVDEL